MRTKWKWRQLSYWRDKQAAMAAVFSLATYLYNSVLTTPHFRGSGEPVIEISTGRIQGNFAKSRDGRSFAEFLGIPFAKPPIKELRFEPPMPVESWNGIRDAKIFAPECMQLEAMVTGRIQGAEDCLYLNLYTPQIHLQYTGPQKLLPVMVFFHGGLFISGGSQMYGPKYFMDNDVVLVVPQYRLGALGFLSTGDNIVPGNMGLKDQNLALQWIQQNIKQFGGDPDQVTLFGNSAGGSSVHFHMLSPFSKGLFHKGISESGTAIKIWTLSKYPKKQSRRFASQLNCPTHSSNVMVDCLKQLDPRALVKPHLATMSPIRDNTDLFVPTIDGKFIPEEPMKMLKNGSYYVVPWLTGVNSGEGLLNTGRILADEKIYKNLNHEWNSWIPLMLDYDKERVNISSKIKGYYFGNFHGKYFAEDVQNITSIYSDRVYFHATRKAALLHSQRAPVYLYYYTYPGDFSFFSLFKAVMPRYDDFVAPEIKIAVDVAKDMFRKYVMRSATIHAPCHADELPLLFNMHRAIEVTRGSKDYEMSRSLVKVWTDFAKLKNYTKLKYQNISWLPVNYSQPLLKYMQLDIKGKLIDEPFVETMKFWDSLKI